MLPVIIDRQKWIRGKGSIPSRLRRATDGKMCCIGFLSKALGATDEQITKLKVMKHVPHEACALFYMKHGWKVREAYPVNDNKGMSDTTRERHIRQLGKGMGVNFVFEN